MEDYEPKVIHAYCIWCFKEIADFLVIDGKAWCWDHAHIGLTAQRGHRSIIKNGDVSKLRRPLVDRQRAGGRKISLCPQQKYDEE